MNEERERANKKRERANDPAGLVPAWGYIRVSTAAQASEGHGLDVQREKISQWCQFNGLELELVHEDAGITGAHTERPGFRAAVRDVLAAAAATGRAAIVVYKLDRLGRSALDVLETIAVLLDAGVRVVSTSDGVDSGSGMGAATLRLLVTIHATFAELDRENIRARLIDGRRRASGENRVYASEPAYGRRVAVDGEVLVEDEGEKAAIERARALRGEGKSFAAIAAALLAEGLRPRRGAKWSTAVVHQLVTGERAPRRRKKGGRIERARAELLGTP